MRHLSLLLAFVLSILSCNNRDNTIVQSYAVETNSDTLKTIKASNNKITKDLVLGKFDYKNDTIFTKVASNHSSKLIYLNKDAYKAFKAMSIAAEKDGIKFTIISGTRNFKEQKAIWERKWEKYKSLKPLDRAQKILEYSSMPSTSRHHWGTDLDLNSLNNSYFNSGKGKSEYDWLAVNANQFGFYQVYTEKNKSRTGYNLEKWHWSYLPLASQYLEFYNKNIINDDINGFKGYEEAQKLRVIKYYVNGISQKAKDYN